MFKITCWDRAEVEIDTKSAWLLLSASSKAHFREKPGDPAGGVSRGHTSLGVHIEMQGTEMLVNCHDSPGPCKTTSGLHCGDN